MAAVTGNVQSVKPLCIAILAAGLFAQPIAQADPDIAGNNWRKDAEWSRWLEQNWQMQVYDIELMGEIGRDICRDTRNGMSSETIAAMIHPQMPVLGPQQLNAVITSAISTYCPSLTVSR